MPIGLFLDNQELAKYFTRERSICPRMLNLTMRTFLPPPTKDIPLWVLVAFLGFMCFVSYEVYKMTAAVSSIASNGTQNTALIQRNTEAMEQTSTTIQSMSKIVQRNTMVIEMFLSTQDGEGLPLPEADGEIPN